MIGAIVEFLLVFYAGGVVSLLLMGVHARQGTEEPSTREIVSTAARWPVLMVSELRK